MLDESAYCTIEEAVAEGALEDPGDDDALVARAEGLIVAASRYLDSVCRSWFYVRTFSTGSPLLLDGRGGSTLRLEAPPISVSVAVGSYSGAAAATWTALSGYAYALGTTRQNPCLERLDGETWSKGRKNWRVVGTLGDVENGERPAAINRATIRLVSLAGAVGELGSDYATGDLRSRLGGVKSESTNGRSVTYAGAGDAGSAAVFAWTGDAIVDAAIAAYRRAFA